MPKSQDTLTRVSPAPTAEPTAGPYAVHECEPDEFQELPSFDVYSAEEETCFAPIADLVCASCGDMEPDPDNAGKSREFRHYELTATECRANAYLLAASWDMRAALKLLLELSARNDYATYREAVREIASGALSKTMPPKVSVIPE